MLPKIIALLMLLAGETLSIYAEMRAAEHHGTVAFAPNFWSTFPVIALAGGLLLAGYIRGYSAFRNIWIVSAASITSILIIEPLLAYGIFRELPGKGATIGLVAGIVGFAATLLWK